MQNTFNCFWYSDISAISILLCRTSASKWLVMSNVWLLLTRLVFTPHDFKVCLAIFQHFAWIGYTTWTSATKFMPCNQVYFICCQIIGKYIHFILLNNFSHWAMKLKNLWSSDFDHNNGLLEWTKIRNHLVQCCIATARHGVKKFKGRWIR